MGTSEDGGPAFPQLEPRDPMFTIACPGMTLRDWFAGQALAGIASANMGLSYGDDAEIAYCFADAMIAARGVAK